MSEENLTQNVAQKSVLKGMVRCDPPGNVPVTVKWVTEPMIGWLHESNEERLRNNGTYEKWLRKMFGFNSVFK